MTVTAAACTVSYIGWRDFSRELFWHGLERSAAHTQLSRGRSGNRPECRKQGNYNCIQVDDSVLRRDQSDVCQCSAANSRRASFDCVSCVQLQYLPKDLRHWYQMAVFNCKNVTVSAKLQVPYAISWGQSRPYCSTSIRYKY